ncbi:DUF368 domain-containing protein [Candidatus Endobugula sertula]|uniref:DUF368 domain-containing protein n=1 Tax=Candidatus Endobugula sertula TaxID=62101 RepID=A0A1D2QM48_9GAMM|nr:DUF368 domain-containing protein [Candidatus Endobugula sertula]
MGAADVVPGVSGGTIAFITGIYQRLLNALKSLHPFSLRILWREGFREFWRAIDGRFLLTLFSGVLVSILSFARVIRYFLEYHPIMMWSFFFGLVLASIVFLVRQTPQWCLQEIVAVVLGALIALGISMLRPAQLPDEWWVMMFSGFIAICAMILPGISGSFILLLMGMYSVFIQALSELNVLLLVSFGVGCIIGLIVFSHLLSFLLHRYLSTMLAALTGLLIGSLNVLWPWKQIIETTVNRYGKVIPLVQENISPYSYEIVTGNSDQLAIAIVVFIVGFLIVFVLEKVNIKY